METFGGMAGHACLLLRRLAPMVMRSSFLTHLRPRRQLHLCGLPRAVYLACTPLSCSTPDPCFRGLWVGTA
eukprot:6206649-Pleurochrysis_carterae.AAC.3